MPDVQILAWLKAKARLTGAEDQLLKAKTRLIDAEEQGHSNILDNAERWVSSLRDRSSTTFDQEGWPDSLVTLICEGSRFHSVIFTNPS